MDVRVVAGRHGANIPVGIRASVSRMKRAVAGAERAAQGASGKWVAHWKMVTSPTGVGEGG